MADHETEHSWTYEGINPHFEVLPSSKVRAPSNGLFPSRLEALDDLIGALESQRDELSLQIAGHKAERRKLRKASPK